MSQKKRTTAEWRELITKQKASGQTQEAWCLANGVNLYTYRDRARRLRQMDGTVSSSRVLFKQTKKRSKETPQQSTQSEGVDKAAWVEIIPNTATQVSAVNEANHETKTTTIRDNNHPGLLVIETGALRFTADAAYPAQMLATLLRGMMKTC